MFHQISIKRSVVTVIAAIILLGGIGVLGWQLSDRSPGAAAAESDQPPPPSGIPTPGVSDPPPPDYHEEMEQDLREVMKNFSSDEIVWIDEDTVVYLLYWDPYFPSKGKVAVADHLPTGAGKSFIIGPTGNTGAGDTDGDSGTKGPGMDDGDSSIGPTGVTDELGLIVLSQSTTDHPDAQEALDRLNNDPRVDEAAAKLLGVE